MNVREQLHDLFLAGVEAVAPDAALLRHARVEKGCLVAGGLSCPLDRGVLVVGAGKGVGPMARALETLLADWPVSGLVVTKYGHGVPLRRIELLEAAHPVPDEAGQIATARLLARVRSEAGLRPVLALFTGGASALTPAPAPGLTLAHVQETTKRLLACGATIHELNAVRKHLSVFSGGQLARAAAPSPVLTFMVSDVVGDQADVIASGPTVPDPSSFADCHALLVNYDLMDHLPEPVRERLQAGLAGHVPETPKPGDPLFARVGQVLVASNAQALAAAERQAGERGFAVYVQAHPLGGEARETAYELVHEALRLQATLKPGDAPICLMAGGETTVTLRGAGRGGRNQEMALAAALALEEQGATGITALFGGTDGTDGPTDAAGGFATSESTRRMREAGHDPVALLHENNSYVALAAAGDLLNTGPTRTNVMDLALLIIEPC